MRAFAYCAKSLAPSARIVTGTEPVTCPPIALHTFDTHQLQADFVFIKLHGLADQPFWYGDHWLTALAASDIANLNLSHTVIFVASCHTPQSPMLHALRNARPRLLVAGHGPNYTYTDDRLAGPDLLALTMRRLLHWRIDPGLAFIIARNKLKRRPSQNLSTRDAAHFEVFS